MIMYNDTEMCLRCIDFYINEIKIWSAIQGKNVNICFSHALPLCICIFSHINKRNPFCESNESWPLILIFHWSNCWIMIFQYVYNWCKINLLDMCRSFIRKSQNFVLKCQLLCTIRKCHGWSSYKCLMVLMFL